MASEHKIASSTSAPPGGAVSDPTPPDIDKVVLPERITVVLRGLRNSMRAHALEEIDDQFDTMVTVAKLAYLGGLEEAKMAESFASYCPRCGQNTPNVNVKHDDLTGLTRVGCMFCKKPTVWNGAIIVKSPPKRRAKK